MDVAPDIDMRAFEAAHGFALTRDNAVSPADEAPAVFLARPGCRLFAGSVLVDRHRRLRSGIEISQPLRTHFRVAVDLVRREWLTGCQCLECPPGAHWRRVSFKPGGGCDKSPLIRHLADVHDLAYADPPRASDSDAPPDMGPRWFELEYGFVLCASTAITNEAPAEFCRRPSVRMLPARVLLAAPRPWESKFRVAVDPLAQVWLQAAQCTQCSEWVRFTAAPASGFDLALHWEQHGGGDDDGGGGGAEAPGERSQSDPVVDTRDMRWLQMTHRVALREATPIPLPRESPVAFAKRPTCISVPGSVLVERRRKRKATGQDLIVPLAQHFRILVDPDKCEWLQAAECLRCDAESTGRWRPVLIKRTGGFDKSNLLRHLEAHHK